MFVNRPSGLLPVNETSVTWDLFIGAFSMIFATYINRVSCKNVKDLQGQRSRSLGLFLGALQNVILNYNSLWMQIFVSFELLSLFVCVYGITVLLATSIFADFLRHCCFFVD